MKSIFSLLLVLALAGIAALPVSAQVPGPHPGYLHALSDLRTARFIVSHNNPDPRVQGVVGEIDRALGEINQAAIDDGKNVDDHLPIDANLDFHGRYRKALDLLDHAHRDIARFEDNAYASGLQHRALHHIDAAHQELLGIVSAWR
jgi:hypothetical protein